MGCLFAASVIRKPSCPPVSPQGPLDQAWGGWGWTCSSPALWGGPDRPHLPAATQVGGPGWGWACPRSPCQLELSQAL